MKKNFFAVAFICLIGACVNGSASDTLDKSVSITFPVPTIPAGSIPNVNVTVDQATVIDVSKPVSDLKKVGDVSLTFVTSSLSDDDLSFVKHVKLDVTPTDGSMPSLTLTDIDVPSSTTNVINLPINADGSALTNYFGEGSVSLHFWLTGDPANASFMSNSVTLTYTMEVNASVAVNKSVTSIGK